MTTHGPSGRAERGQLVDRVEHAPAAEQHLADEDEVVLAASRGGRESARRSCRTARRRRARPSIQPSSSQRANWRRALWNSPSLVSTRSGQLRRGAAANSRTRKSWVFGAKTIASGCAGAELARDMRPGPPARPRPSPCPTCGRRGGRRRSTPAPGPRSWRRATDDGCARRNAAGRDRRQAAGEQRLETQRVGPQRPQLREHALLERRAQIGRAGRAAGARACCR